MGGLVEPVAPLRLSVHPFQRTGALVLAARAGKRVEEITIDDIQVAADALVAELAALAQVKKGEPGYWWRSVLSVTVFPNTSLHYGHEPAKATASFGKVLGVPSSDAATVGICDLCGDVADRLIAKTAFPLSASESYRNTTPPGMGGWPVCWPCRVCLWLMPYGAVHSGGRLGVFDTADDALLERLVSEQLAANHQLLVLAPASQPEALQRPQSVLVALLRRYRRRPRAGVRLLVFKSGNKEKDVELSVFALDTAAAGFVAGLSQDPKADRAFDLAARRLPERGTHTGYDRLARGLFDHFDQRAEFLRLVRPIAGEPGAWELVSRYAREVL